MIVKVCGLVNKENLLQVEALGVDYLGRIFHPSSPRDMSAETNTATKTKQVGVFVNASTSHILEMVKKHGLSAVQLHGSEPIEQLQELKDRGPIIMKAISVGDDFPVDEVKKYAPFCDYFIFDTKGKYAGGNGVRFKWDLLQAYTQHVPFLLSGGINPQHAQDIKNFKHPAFAGVDLNSGFETKPGFKNIELLKTFLHEIH
ncbi:phosphoribosylanthranilate isomerase [Bacteroidota bacterium]